jgi:CBS domain-containing protein
MRINDVMTAHLTTCPPSSMVTAAAKQMREEDIGDVLVVDEDGELLGIVTDRDVVVRVVAEGRDPESTPLGDVISGDPLTIDPEQEVEEAARLMRERGVRRLPVVSDGRPVGVVSLGDLAVERDPDSALAEISAKPGNT